MQQVLETIMSAFVKTAPEFADTTHIQQETPCDHVCRTNPFLFAFSG